MNELDKKTVPAKVKALNELINHTVNGSSSIPKELDRHSDIKMKLNTAFGTTITLDDLADFVFLTSVKDYDFQTNTHKSKELFDFASFKLDLETAYESRMPTTKKAVVQPNATAKCSKHKSTHWFEGLCRRCNPCPKCTKDGMKFTCHALDSPSCISSQKEKQKEEPGKSNERVPSSHLTKAVTFIADSGNTDPIINNKDAFDLYYGSPFSHVELAGSGQSMQIEGAGTLQVLTPHGTAQMDNVLYCPTASDNLLSISRLDDKGFASLFCDDIYVFPKEELQKFFNSTQTQPVFKGTRDGSLYKIDMQLASTTVKDNNPTTYLSQTPNRSLEEWHLATNHLNTKSLLQMPKLVQQMGLSNQQQFDCKSMYSRQSKS